ncbi:MAG: hypothetical protein IKE05_05755 [Clostridia bacterium]|nr:hypothetical protein [Clostridia bacterium]
MITLTENGREMQIPECEKIIGCQGDNLIERRQFLISSKYKGVDIRNFSFVLKVQPINVRKLPYYNELQKAVSDDTILLTWEIRKHDLTDSGKLKVQLNVLDEEGRQLNSYIGAFTVKNSIESADSQGAIIPPSIFEQAIVTTNKFAEEAREILDEIKGIQLGLGTASRYDVGINEGQIAVLIENGKLPNSVIPKIATTEVYTASSNTAMENLDVQSGDMCIRTDMDATYVYSDNTEPNRRRGEESNWKKIATNFDAENKQNIEDDNLMTEDKTIVGAINEIYSSQSARTGIITLTDEWEIDSDDVYTQDVPVENLLETDTVILDVILESGSQDVWDCIYRAVTYDGYIKFYAYASVPRETIRIKYEIRRYI